jgi:hypothetical protein
VQFDDTPEFFEPEGGEVCDQGPVPPGEVPAAKPKKGGPAKRRARSASPRVSTPRKAAPRGPYARPTTLGGRPEGGASFLHGTADLDRWHEQAALEAVMNKLAEGTREGYSGGWREWVLFRQASNSSPFLLARTPAERREDEDALLSFTVHLAKVMGRQDSTIKNKLFAIRYAHIASGYPDPVLRRARLWAALDGFKRWQGAARRKYPATPRMLRWLRTYLRDDAGLVPADAAAAWAMLDTAFYFLLRASEYLVQEGRSGSEARVISGLDLKPRRGNEDVGRYAGAEELVLYIKGSKTDQYNVGETRNQFSSGCDLCPLLAWAEYEEHFPERLHGSERHLPLGRFKDGSPIRRVMVQQWLELAAAALGVDKGRMGSHSLRIGGATAMYHVVGDLQVVRRFGRWASDTFHSYLWDSHEQLRGISGKMARDESELRAPR